MDKFIQKVLDNPVMVTLLAICFAISMLLFWRRIKRERRADYRRPTQPNDGGRS